MKSARTLIINSCLIVCLLLLATACNQRHDATAPSTIPPLMLWAWEAPQDLTSINPKQTGIAALILSINITKNKITYYTRQQPLKIPVNTYVIAVVHIGKLPVKMKLNAGLAHDLALRIKDTYGKGNYKELQIDYDALASEHDFYKQLLTQLRKEVGNQTSISITSIASWCTTDPWLLKANLPINYVVPMFFSLDKDSERQDNFIKNFNPSRLAPYCRGPIGLSTHEKWDVPIRSSNTIYVYNKGSWQAKDLQKAYSLRIEHSL